MREINYSDYFWQDDKVRLRALREEDWEDHYYNRFDSPARRLLECEVELPPTNAEAKKFTEAFSDFSLDRGRIMFTIENMDGENVGGLNLNSIDERNGTFSIGIQIDRDHRGKGYGTRAIRILLKYAFFERRLNKFNDSVLEGNEPSAAMMRKLGCVQEGVRRQVIYTDGKYQDMILFGLTKDEFIDKGGLA
ncbi:MULTISPECIES: GNAT family N-acetyltransferase [Paenibacillus]|uniref:RimJ/RimL family protein N-acetyltransferase n=1 Tax=Paenibacillus pabuli TaxID=1472 RepID=A0A855Y7Y2_9BACL|nr:MULTISPECIES: GNAT family protein [Paenibacillus]PWW36756.1 RimJ/RimL family protein N-acetyltransferase [Paenibacillus pabuli]PXW04137.1 RimJ/RimL family protein N-acetyltransferase [Paenibacillus taichungensis]QLG40987.1 GNAT family N-acetyltransferase [Paenibacillus sp. E222]RAJ00617.1 RimJ/RimL family protein N-acetyltransferase [Paenibacillus pabuli]SEN45382.1 Protein N-acetyltransferase, RimJ/RimL family [Paenibacillus sp. OK076]